MVPEVAGEQKRRPKKRAVLAFDRIATQLAWYPVLARNSLSECTESTRSSNHVPVANKEARGALYEIMGEVSIEGCFVQRRGELKLKLAIKELIFLVAVQTWQG